MTAEHDLLIKLIDEVRSPRVSLSIGDATYLVECCLRAGFITISRAAELLGLRLEEARARWGWCSTTGGTGYLAEHSTDEKPPSQ